jgi:hypothetical protein
VNVKIVNDFNSKDCCASSMKLLIMEIMIILYVQLEFKYNCTLLPIEKIVHNYIIEKNPLKKYKINIFPISLFGN